MTSHYTPVFSCEFFPPRNEKGMQKLRQVQEKLKVAQPNYFSVTFGAAGSTQDKTFDTVVDIQQNAGIDAAPHLSCIGSQKDNIAELLNKYKEKGIKRIVALRGDRPSGLMGRIGDFKNANQLVQFIRDTTGDHFHIEVAAYPEFHPQARSPSNDLDFFKQKVEAGANGAITQYFYNADAYFRFLDECEKRQINIPIYAGIMPITNVEQLLRFSDACGAEIPRWVRLRLQELEGDSAAIAAFGEEVVTQLCQRLIDEKVVGLHFYTLNRAAPTLKIVKNLNMITDTVSI